MITTTCCCIFSIPAGCTILGFICLTLACTVYGINWPFFQDVNQAIIVNWCILMIASGCLAILAAYFESLILAVVTSIVFAVVSCYWLSMAIVPLFLDESDAVELFCVNSRCAESLWLIELHYRTDLEKDVYGRMRPETIYTEAYINRRFVTPIYEDLNQSAINDSSLAKIDVSMSNDVGHSIPLNNTTVKQNKEPYENQSINSFAGNEKNISIYGKVKTENEMPNNDDNKVTFITILKRLFLGQNYSSADNNTRSRQSRNRAELPSMRSGEPRRLVFFINPVTIGFRGNRPLSLGLFIISVCWYIYCNYVFLLLIIYITKNMNFREIYAYVKGFITQKLGKKTTGK